MAHASQKTKTVKIQNSNLFTFFATLSGIVVGVVASLAMMGPMVRSEVASATRALDARPVSTVTNCVSPNDEGGASSTAKPSSPAPKPGGGSGGGTGGSTTVINKIIGGQSNKTVASMSNTGPGSHNVISTVNKNITTITNNNEVNVTNSNDQEASSGSANVSGNTNGGSANSGKATNTNETSTDISISN